MQGTTSGNLVMGEVTIKLEITEAGRRDTLLWGAAGASSYLPSPQSSYPRAAAPRDGSLSLSSCHSQDTGTGCS